MGRNTIPDGVTAHTNELPRPPKDWASDQEKEVLNDQPNDLIVDFVAKATKKPDQVKVIQISASLPEKWSKMFDRYFSVEKAGRTAKTQVIENALTEYFAKDGFTVMDDGSLQQTIQFPADQENAGGKE